MSSSDDHGVDDEVLVRYLTGRVTSDEAERLDALSISDDAVAERLRAVENDLVDGYARGDLMAEVRDGFNAAYLTSPAHLEKVRFAAALYAREKHSTRSDLAPLRLSRGRFAAPQWRWAVAALVVVAVTGLLAAQNLRLRREVAAARAARAALEQREQDLQGQLRNERSAQTQIAAELARVRQALAASDSPGQPGDGRGGVIALSFLLMPSRRGIADVTQIAIPRGTRQMEVRLLLEADEFARYRVTLKEPASGRDVWRSAVLAPERSADGKVVRTSVPAAGLAPQHYVFELTGIPKAGEPDVIASYPVAVMVK
jgi:hypothetical protein